MAAVAHAPVHVQSPLARTVAVTEWHARSYRRTWRATITTAFLNPVFFLLSGRRAPRAADRRRPGAARGALVRRVRRAGPARRDRDADGRERRDVAGDGRASGGSARTTRCSRRRFASPSSCSGRWAGPRSASSARRSSSRPWPRSAARSRRRSRSSRRSRRSSSGWRSTRRSPRSPASLEGGDDGWFPA